MFHDSVTLFNFRLTTKLELTFSIRRSDTETQSNSDLQHQNQVRSSEAECEVRERLGQLRRVLALLCLVVILCKGFSRLQLCERLTELNTCRSSLCSLVLFRAEARQQTAAVRHDAGEDGTR